MNTYRFLIILLFAFLTVRCDNGTENLDDAYKLPNNISEIIPLNTFSVYYYHVSGYTDVSEIPTWADSLVLFDRKTINSKECFLTQGHFPAVLRYDTMAIVGVDDEAFTVYFLDRFNASKTKASETFAPAYLPAYLLKTPIEKGKEWDVADWDTIPDFDLGTISIQNTDTAITVDSTEYKHVITLCHKYTTGINYYYIFPGLGLIKYEEFGAWLGYTTELYSWKAK